MYQDRISQSMVLQLDTDKTKDYEQAIVPYFWYRVLEHTTVREYRPLEGWRILKGTQA
jgi:hypothetical protein